MSINGTLKLKSTFYGSEDLDQGVNATVVCGPESSHKSIYFCLEPYSDITKHSVF